jgi:hypothetical protein
MIARFSVEALLSGLWLMATLPVLCCDCFLGLSLPGKRKMKNNEEERERTATREYAFGHILKPFDRSHESLCSF